LSYFLLLAKGKPSETAGRKAKGANVLRDYASHAARERNWDSFFVTSSHRQRGDLQVRMILVNKNPFCPPRQAGFFLPKCANLLFPPQCKTKYKNTVGLFGV
jgi:hypothetical protein